MIFDMKANENMIYIALKNLKDSKITSDEHNVKILIALRVKI